MIEINNNNYYYFYFLENTNTFQLKHWLSVLSKSLMSEVLHEDYLPSQHVKAKSTSLCTAVRRACYTLLTKTAEIKTIKYHKILRMLSSSATQQV